MSTHYMGELTGIIESTDGGYCIRLGEIGHKVDCAFTSKTRQEMNSLVNHHARVFGYVTYDDRISAPTFCMVTKIIDENEPVEEANE